VLSGSYLGDKTSPLSETTVLASQLVGADLYTHIRAQVWTSVPAFAVSLVVFTLLGMAGEGIGPDVVATPTELAQLGRLYWITPINLIPLVALLAMSLKRSPSSLAILAAALLAGVLGVFTQPEAVTRFLADPEITGAKAAVKAVWMAMATGFQANSGLASVDALLSRGGMDSMLKTIWLIIAAVNFGTLLEEFGLLAKLIDPMIARARTTGGLFLTTAATALGLNIVAADQYIALVLPARVFRSEFEKRGLAPQNLSRAVADAGTVTSPLVPWNSCGAYMSAVLGIPTLSYMPYAVFNIVSPILTVVIGYVGFRVQRIGKDSSR
jgi:NhaC family Na+:H+ antiporter